MKVFIIGTAYPLRGAFAQLNVTLARHLSKRHDVEIVSFKRQYPQVFFPGKTQIDPGKHDLEIPVKYMIDSLNPLTWLKTAQYLRGQKADIVIFRYWMPFFAPCFGSIAYLVKKWTAARVIFICDNVIPHEPRAGDVALTRFAFRYGDSFLVHARSLEKDLRTFVRNPRYAITPLPIDNIFGKPVPKGRARKVLGIRYERVILFFGFIRRYKGLHHLIDAMPKIVAKAKAKLIIVGEFYDDEEKYRRQIVDLGISDSVEVRAEYIKNEEVGTYFSACDVVVLPYVSGTQSAVVPVAYYFDKPVITTSVGGIPEVVDDGKTGIIVQPGNAEEISNAVIDFYTKKMGQRFGPYIKKAKHRHSWVTYVAAVEKLFD